MSVGAVSGGGGGTYSPQAVDADTRAARLQALAVAEAAIESSMAAMSSGRVDGNVDTYA